MRNSSGLLETEAGSLQAFPLRLHQHVLTRLCAGSGNRQFKRRVQTLQVAE
jgi:hypothetical protein